MSEEAERDYETEARGMGWKPPEEFKGDPDKHISAEKYVTRGETQIPLMLANQKRMTADLQSMKSSMEFQAQHFEKSTKQQVDAARKAERETMRTAVVDGDTDTYAAAEKRLDNIVDPTPTPKAAPVDEDLQEFKKNNDWYGKDLAMTGAAEAYSNMLADTKKLGGADNYNQVVEYIKTEFPHKFGNPRRDDPPAVGDARRAPKNAGKSFSNLPADAQDSFDRFYKDGVFGKDTKIEDAQKKYVSTYQWDKK